MVHLRGHDSDDRPGRFLLCACNERCYNSPPRRRERTVVDTVSVENVLARAARLVAENEDPDQAIQSLLDLIVESAGATKGSLMRTEGEGLEPVATHGLDLSEGLSNGTGRRGSIPLMVGGRVEGVLLLHGAHGEQIMPDAAPRPLGPVWPSGWRGAFRNRAVRAQMTRPARSHRGIDRRHTTCRG